MMLYNLLRVGFFVCLSLNSLTYGSEHHPMKILDENANKIKICINKWGTEGSKDDPLSKAEQPSRENLGLLVTGGTARRNYGIRKYTLIELKQKFSDKDALVSGMKSLGFEGLSKNGKLLPLEQCSIDDLYAHYNRPSQGEWNTILKAMTQSFFLSSIRENSDKSYTGMGSFLDSYKGCPSLLQKGQAQSLLAINLAIEYVMMYNKTNDLEEMVKFTQDRLKQRYSQSVEERFLKTLLTYHNVDGVNFFTRVQASFNPGEWLNAWEKLARPTCSGSHPSLLYYGVPSQALNGNQVEMLHKFLKARILNLKHDTPPSKKEEINKILFKSHRIITDELSPHNKESSTSNMNIVTLLAMLNVLGLVDPVKMSEEDGVGGNQTDKEDIQKWIDSIYKLVKADIGDSKVWDHSFDVDKFLLELYSPKKVLRKAEEGALLSLEEYQKTIESQYTQYCNDRVFRFWYNLYFIFNSRLDRYQQAIFHTPKSFLESMRTLTQELLQKKSATYKRRIEEVETFTYSDNPITRLLDNRNPPRYEYLGYKEDVLYRWFYDALVALPSDKFKQLIKGDLKKHFEDGFSGVSSDERKELLEKPINSKVQKKIARWVMRSFKMNGYDESTPEIFSNSLLIEGLKLAFGKKKRQAKCILANGVYAGFTIPDLFDFMKSGVDFKTLEEDLTLGIEESLKTQVKERILSIQFKDLSDDEQTQISKILNPLRKVHGILPLGCECMEELQDKKLSFLEEKKESVSRFISFLRGKDTFKWSLEKAAHWFFLSTWTVKWERDLCGEDYNPNKLTVMNMYRNRAFLNLLSHWNSTVLGWLNHMYTTRRISLLLPNGTVA